MVRKGSSVRVRYWASLIGRENDERGQAAQTVGATRYLGPRMTGATRAVRRTGALGLVVVAAFFAAVPVAGAHTLLEERAEAAAERYASFQQGGGFGSILVRGPGGEEINLRTDRFDSGRCSARGPHRRICPVEYEGKDYDEDDCFLDDLAGALSSDEEQDCFERSRVTCDQFVAVTLRGTHTTRRRTTRGAQVGPTLDFGNLSVAGGAITCRRSTESAPASPPPG